MAETEIVTRFKEFARARLLTALREADSAALPKQPTYTEIRASFTAEQGWPNELDEIEPGPAPTPLWLNRLHWIVAELVQTRVLEPSEGRDTLHPTPFGRDLLQVPAPTLNHALGMPRSGRGSSSSPAGRLGGFRLRQIGNR